jgi:hypothetical protein
MTKTLRDEIAITAMREALRNPETWKNITNYPEKNRHPVKHAAQWFYKMADEMLEARGEK